MRRRNGNTAADARAGLAGFLEELAARYDPLFPGSPYGGQAARLRAGAPVDVVGWEIADWAPGVAMYGRYTLGEDDTITEV